MSTRSSIVYLHDEDIHLYRESFDSGNVYLTMPAKGDWAVTPHGLQVVMGQADWDKLVDEYVKVRTEERGREAKRMAKVRRCAKKYGGHDWKEIEGIRALFNPGRSECTRCGAWPEDGPSDLELLAEEGTGKVGRGKR